MQLLGSLLGEHGDLGNGLGAPLSTGVGRLGEQEALGASLGTELRSLGEPGTWRATVG